MSNLNIQYLYWLLSLAAKKLGAWGLLGILLALASLLFYQTKLTKLEQLTQQAQLLKVAEQAKSTQTKPIAEPPVAQNYADEIATFYDRFPTESAVPEILSSVNKLAAKHNLALNSGDYKLNKIKSTSQPNVQILTKYEMVLPVKGPYVKIRTFISEALKQEPAIALMDVQFKRENTMSPIVDARLAFVLFVKGQP